MPTNKNAQLRYQILDRCFSDFKHKYTFEDLKEKVNDALYDLTGCLIREKVVTFRMVKLNLLLSIFLITK